ncbi:MAG: hypothetical protein GXY32_11355 [Ruminococcaceae bacterium]|nr:hypothetical protein [Oscillospiraceae bacterium]
MKCGLIGEKLGHSYSKHIHRQLGLYDYALLETPPENLGRLLGDKTYAGFNVTIPYKRAVAPYCSALDDTARAIGSVNTIKRMADGRLVGYNTDFEGLCSMVARAGIALQGRQVLILGSGGTGKTAQAVCAAAGAARVSVVSRTGAVNYGNVYAQSGTQVIINTTPVGMHPHTEKSPLELAAFPQLEGVVDVIYNPLRTRLLQQAAQLGVRHAGGLYMLVRQATAAGEIFTGKALAGRSGEIFESLEASVKNIVLIGMPGSGKTSIGMLAAEKTGRAFYDTDQMIEARTGLRVPDIFAKYGEQHFRALEKEAVAACGRLSGVVIAAGGGAPLCAENTLNLRQNAQVFHITRALEQLATDGRPLSAGLAALGQMEQQRAPFYERCADRRIDNNGSLEAAAEAVVEDFYETAGN